MIASYLLPRRISLFTNLVQSSTNQRIGASFNPEETEFALREKLPQKYWIDINTLMVTHGQNICKPTKPKCSECPIANYCAKIL